MMMTKNSRRGRVMIALAAVLIFAGSAAEARMGGRGSFGSRGARTWSAPPSTKTAPGTAAPVQRSQVPNQGINRPATAAPTAAQPRRFGLGTGLMAGLFGAGLLGMLMGNGFFGGLAGLASVFGLLLQIGLVVLLVTFAMKWFRGRQQPAYARSSEGTNARPSGTPGRGSVPPTGPVPGPMGGLATGLGSMLGGNATATSPGPVIRDNVVISDEDFAGFERSLVALQDAYTRSDIETIWSLTTPEMAGYIQEELSDFAARGEVNSVTDVKLLQGDLAEAWGEDGIDFATVAMRYNLRDVTTEKATGRVVDGDPEALVEATEVWTFRREGQGPWLLSAIQQVL